MKIRKHVSMFAAIAAFATTGATAGHVVTDAESLTRICDDAIAPAIQRDSLPNVSIVTAAREQLMFDDHLVADAAPLDVSNLAPISILRRMLIVPIEDDGRSALELLNSEFRPLAIPHDDELWNTMDPGGVVQDDARLPTSSSVIATPGAIVLLTLAGCVGCVRHRAEH